MMVVSYMSSGALSVALSDLPIVPKTVSTSGNVRMMRSCSCNRCEACPMEIPGRAVGMYKAEPSNSGGINWLPILSARGRVTTKKIRLSSSVVLRNRRQSRRTGRYKACVTRESGFRDSGRRRPRMKRTISTGTSVTVRLLELHYPVDDLLLEVKRGDDTADFASNAIQERKKRSKVQAVAKLEPAQIFLAVHRLDFSVYFRRIEPEEFALLGALRSGKTIERAIELAFRKSAVPAADRAAFVQHSL